MRNERFRHGGNRWRVSPAITADGTAYRPLSIGIVLHDFALGGTERIALRLARAWVAQGARVTIFCGSTNGALKALLDPRVDVHAAPIAIPRGRGSRRQLGKAAAAFFDQQPVDGIFVPGNFHWSIVPALHRIRQEARPAIVAQVSASLDKPQRGWLRRAIFNLRMRVLLRHADAIVTLSDVARLQTDRIMGRHCAQTIALPALENDVAPPMPAQAKPIILAGGRLVPEKGFAELIDAFSRLRHGTAELVIVGDGPEMEPLKAHAARLGLADRISLPGYVSDIRPWLDAARIFVMPSHFEGYPAVLIEALAAGRPVVATRCTPAVADLLVHPGFGRVVPILDVPALAVAIQDLLTAPGSDPDILADAVSHHKIGPVADAYLDLFADIVELYPAA